MTEFIESKNKYENKFIQSISAFQLGIGYVSGTEEKLGKIKDELSKVQELLGKEHADNIKIKSAL